MPTDDLAQIPILLPDGTTKPLGECTADELAAAQEYAKRTKPLLDAYTAKLDELTAHVTATGRQPTREQQAELAELELQLADDPRFLAIHKLKGLA
ncbi:MAG: hypothetical protein R2733_11750 [Acidimicrobiales bacterium]